MPDIDDAHLIRRADRRLLDAALAESRARTLRTFAAVDSALRPSGGRIPYSPQVNPPLWELGHVGWFQEYWIGRNPQRMTGIAADPQAPRSAPRLADADALYDSSRIEHTRRWHLPLPDAAATRDYLARTLDQTRSILAQCEEGPSGRGLRYFAWLALMHEDMHHEAALYMAQALSIRPLAQTGPAAGEAAGQGAGELAFATTSFQVGEAEGDFAFDNELAVHPARVEAFRIDAEPVGNAAFASFVESGGYGEPRWWTEQGWQWRSRNEARQPRDWRAGRDGWRRCAFGQLEPLIESAPVVNLCLHEAQAWCRWAGRRLPTEVEWELAASSFTPDAAGSSVDRPFRWGQVWEWTASTFGPYPAFTPHPYADYSQPWFGTRQVLRGASFATHPRLRHPRYRNFFTPERNDIFAGFRSCALVP